MNITDIIWKEKFVEKIEVKHNVTVYETEEILNSNPLVRKVAKGRVRGEDIYSAQAYFLYERSMILLYLYRLAK